MSSPRPPNAFFNMDKTHPDLNRRSSTQVSDVIHPEENRSDSPAPSSHGLKSSMTPSSYSGPANRFFPRSQTTTGDSSPSSVQGRQRSSGSNPRAISYHPGAGQDTDSSHLNWSDMERQSSSTANSSDIVLQGRS